MEKTIKILFASNLNLGATSTAIKDLHRLQTLQRTCSLAGEHDLFIIGGNLFKITDIDNNSINTVKTELAKLNSHGVPVLLLPGPGELTENHEPEPTLDRLGFSFIFNTNNREDLYTLEKNNNLIHITGFNEQKPAEMNGARPQGSNGLFLGVTHQDDHTNRVDDPACNQNNIFDLVLIGNNTAFKIDKSDNAVKAIYSGSLEASTFSEKGDRYAVSITIKDNYIESVNKYTVNTAVIKEININTSDYVNREQLLSSLKTISSPTTIGQLTLTGIRNFNIDHTIIKDINDLFLDLKITDQTIPSIGLMIDQYCNEATSRGDFFRLLKEKIDTEQLPADINLKNLTVALQIVSKFGINKLEDKLCDLINA